MAYYGIPSAGLSLTASTASDTISMSNQGGSVSAITILGEGGNDIIAFGAIGTTGSAQWSGLAAGSGAFLTLSGQSVSYSTGIGSGALFADVEGIITAGPGGVGATFIRTSEVRGNAGNDSILLSETLSEISGATLGGGQGNDYIGAGNFFNNTFSDTFLSGTFGDLYLEGGNGNDTIHLSGAAVHYSALSANGNQGDDLVEILGDGATISGGSYIGLGQGNDVFSGDVSGFYSSSIVGGQGNDTINFTISTGIESYIAGDASTDSVADTDGADSIALIADSFQSGDIVGNGGNDTIYLDANLTGSTVKTNDGFDAITAVSGVYKDATFQLGKQGDTFVFTGSANIDSSTFSLGKGLDSFYLSGDVGSGGTIINSTVNGGAGNDYIFGGSTLSGTMKATLQYDDSLDSTLDAFDTIAITQSDGFSGTYTFRYEPGSVTQASFSGAGVTGTNGVVVFSSTVSSDVTSRVELLEENTSSGNVAVFQDGANNTYLFIDGGASDSLVVQLGSNNNGGALSAATVSVAVGRNIDVKLDF